MPLNHTLAADGWGTPLDEARLQKATAVLKAFGFHYDGVAFVADDTFAWVTVTEVDGRLHVHAQSPLPAHLIEQVLAALDGLVTEAGLVRTDPISRREISPAEWARAVEDESRRATGSLR